MFDRNNCALGEKCECSWPGGLMKNTEYWKCPNWGRSTLAAPRIVSQEKRYGGRTRTHWQNLADERQRKAEKAAAHTKVINERLRAVRHSDPVKHLAKKGVKVNR